MDQAATPSDDSAAPAPSRWRTRKLWGRVAIGVFAVGAFVLFRGQVPSQLAVTFEVPPTLYTREGNVPRQAVAGLVARFVDAKGAEVGRTSLTVGRLDGPLAAAVPLQVPDGDYVVWVVVDVGGGRKASLVGRFTADGDGPVRVALEKPKAR